MYPAEKIDAMLSECWASVAHSGLALDQFLMYFFLQFKSVSGSKSWNIDAILSETITIQKCKDLKIQRHDWIGETIFQNPQ